MQTIVNNKMNRPVAYSYAIPGLAGHPRIQSARILNTGPNEVDAEEFEACTAKSPIWEAWKAEGKIVIEAHVEADEGLASLSPEAARKLVSETLSLELLDGWFDKEQRADAKKAIRKQRAFLEKKFAGKAA